jgi:hypothetical protein
MTDSLNLGEWKSIHDITKECFYKPGPAEVERVYTDTIYGQTVTITRYKTPEYVVVKDPLTMVCPSFINEVG